jgi:gluconate 2-dehydrogenase gamma chain
LPQRWHKGGAAGLAPLQMNKRHLFGSLRASTVKGGLPWKAGSADPPAAITPDGWKYFTPQEAAAVEAFVDRLIPPDPQPPGGKDCGCAVFIDGQLAGPGRFDGYYMSGPFREGTKQRGPQSPVTPAQQYRKALAALDAAGRAKFANHTFAGLSDDQKDEVIRGLEDGSFKFDGTDGKKFFELILKDKQYGFSADPICGGNEDMVAWKMIGFPGAHYDYRDWIDRHALFALIAYAQVMKEIEPQPDRPNP